MSARKPPTRVPTTNHKPAGDDWPKSLNRRLKFACYGLGPATLALALDSDAATIRRYLTGTPPPADFIARLCALSHLSADWLLNGLGPMYTNGRPAA